ncbi:MAG: ammonium transporter [Clostridia bacterium]|nr:ammonium transporter [Clostridia bacterium]
MSDSSVSIAIWFLIGAALVFFMQCGFAMVETGFTRAKSAGNIIMKNLMDFCIGTVVFMLLGFGLMMGQDAVSYFCGAPNLGIFSDWNSFTSADAANFVFNLVFCATAATIVSGAMAERTRFISYCIYSALISLVVYPIEAGWVWGGGWLISLEELTNGTLPGFIDYAGSGCIHTVGGVAALIGACFLGPRIGKYERDKNGKVTKVNAIQGHSLTLGALGVFILWFGWYGFNGAAAQSAEELAAIFVNTTIAPAVASCVTMIFTWILHKKPDVSMTLNAALAGLVGITAGCSCMNAVGAVVVGFVSGFLVVGVANLLEKILHIDDPVGAVAVHCANGIWGIIACGFFACTGWGDDGLAYSLDSLHAGVFFGGSGACLATQLIGIIAIVAWTAALMLIVFWGMKYIPVMIKFRCNPIKAVSVAREQGWNGLRAPAEDEISGLDISEHGLVSAYADFLPTVPSYDGEGAPVDVTDVAPASLDLAPADSVKYTRISIITGQDKFLTLKDALAQIGVTGMTVSNVMGCGAQSGKTGQYRGVKTTMHLIPKMQVDVVVSTVDPGLVVAVAQKVLNDGQVGAGKIFVSAVEDVMRVRTGETGADALTNENGTAEG